MLRRTLVLVLFALALPLAAQPRPPKLEPLPELPPPPPGAADLQDGTGIKNESLDHGVRAPLWVIKRF
jgi:hypothetical protein